MPEVPDLVVLQEKLNQLLPGRSIRSVAIRESIVLRVGVQTPFQTALPGMGFKTIWRRGPFLVLDLTPVAPDSPDEPLQLIVHFMLAGRLQLQSPGDRMVAKVCFSLTLDNGQTLHYADAKRMGKVYLTRSGLTQQIPGFDGQGTDVLSPDFSLERFRSLIAKKRNQVRVFIMDQTRLSAIGNAYADEILFDAKIHPKTLCSQLSPEEIEGLYQSIVRVLAWGIAEVRGADQPLEAKVRGHVKVRNRKGEPCPVCATTIRRVGVLGYDSFFCPHCQPARRGQMIPWERTF